jgi:glycerophosphoryl diester phosphodiesterase
MNPWLDRRVLCYAHQGGAREGPSSAMWTLQQAVAHGADAIELDVHATADGQLVVCHDATVDRTTNATGAIANLTLDELRRLDNAYWWVPGEVVDHSRPPDAYPYRGRAPADPSFGIATVEEVLDTFPGTFLNFDIKQTAPVVEPYEEKLARLLQTRGRLDDVIVASFNDAATDAFRRYAPEIGTSAGTMAFTEFWRAVQQGGEPPELPHVALQAPHRIGEMVVINDALVTAAHGHGLAVHAWTIDDPNEMAELIDLGVDGIMTDVPSVAVEVIRRR